MTERHMQRLRRGSTAALTYLDEALRAGVVGVEARGRVGGTADVITLLDGLRGLLGPDEH